MITGDHGVNEADVCLRSASMLVLQGMTQQVTV
jgi:hypothetical protein